MNLAYKRGGYTKLAEYGRSFEPSKETLRDVLDGAIMQEWRDEGN